MLAARHLSGLGVTLISILLTLALFVYSEAIPKTFAVRHPTRVALALATPTAALERLLRPVVGALVWFADLQAPGRGVATAPTITEPELIRLSATAAAEGTITSDDAVLIERTFTFGDRTVEEVMVPRLDIVSVPLGATVAEALDTAVRAGHRRLPVCRDTIDEVEGVVHLRTLAAAATTDPGGPVRSHLRPPLFVPESKRIVELLAEMQNAATHVAIVVDEHGGTAGLATIEDIAEELLGAIGDEGSRPTRPARKIGAGRWLLDGRLTIDDAESILESPLPRGDWSTVAGLLMGRAGRVLEEGDEVTFDGLRFRIARARRQRILAVDVEVPGVPD